MTNLEVYREQELIEFLDKYGEDFTNVQEGFDSSYIEYLEEALEITNLTKELKEKLLTNCPIREVNYENLYGDEERDKACHLLFDLLEKIQEEAYQKDLPFSGVIKLDKGYLYFGHGISGYFIV